MSLKKNHFDDESEEISKATYSYLNLNKNALGSILNNLAFSLSLNSCSEKDFPTMWDNPSYFGIVFPYLLYKFVSLLLTYPFLLILSYGDKHNYNFSSVSFYHVSPSLLLFSLFLGSFNWSYGMHLRHFTILVVSSWYFLVYQYGVQIWA